MPSGASGNRNDELEDFWEEELQRRPEVRIINKYAAVMAYVRVGLKGVGALALLWATIVLLSGFVSNLTKDDFKSLTIIVFVQAAGLFDAMGDDRFAFFGKLIDSLDPSSENQHVRTQSPTTQRHQWKTRLVMSIMQVLVHILFFSVAIFTIAGPIICLALSALRVGKQDYGIAVDDTYKANLKLALNLFYYVSLAHGALCLLYIFVELVADEMFVKIVSQRYGISTEVLDGYFQATKQICANNPASSDSWNLITYGASLLDSHLPEDYLSGGRVLTMLIDQDTPVPITWMLIRSPRQRIQKLIGTLAWKSPAEREMRWFAARIVEHLAGHLKLAHFPGALECISSLFDTSCYSNGDQEALALPFVIGRSKSKKRKNFLRDFFLGENNSSTLEQDNKKMDMNSEGIEEDLVLPGLRILENLAHDRHNCTLIYSTKNLLSRVISPVSSNKLVEDIKSNAAWIEIVDGSLKVVSRLMGSSGSTSKEMCNLIANDSNTVTNRRRSRKAPRIRDCTTPRHHLCRGCSRRDTRDRDDAPSPMCQPLSRRTSPSRRSDGTASSTQSKGTRQPRLHNAATSPVSGAQSKGYPEPRRRHNTSCATNKTVGHRLAETHQTSTRAQHELLDSKINTMKCKISATDSVEIEISTACRISAAVILKNLSNYVKEPTLRKVLVELLPIEAEASSTTTPRCWERAISCIKAITNDIENPSDGVQDKPSTLQRRSHIRQCGEKRLLAELLLLVTTIRASGNVNFAEILISQPQPVALEGFVARFKKMVEDNMLATPACLAIQKLICKMVKELIPLDRNAEVIERHNIVGALLKASKMMARLESRMIFMGVDPDCHGVHLRPLLCDLAKEAEDHLKRRKQELDINAPPAGVP